MLPLLFGLLSFSCGLAFSDDASFPIPKTIYHYGHKAYLIEDARLDTIDEWVWTNSIMGGKSSWQLPQFRRGLYGSSHPAISDYFGTGLLGTEKTPWLMAIHLKDECRTKPAFSPTQIREHPAFSNWIPAQTETDLHSVREFNQQCFGLDVSGDEVPEFESLFVQQEGDCTRTIEAFMKNQRVRIAADDLWDESFYVRDRDCIESIDGSALEVLRMMAETNGFWKQEVSQKFSRGSLKQLQPGIALFAILNEALLDEPQFEKKYPADYQKLKAAALQTDIHPTRDRKDHFLKEVLTKYFLQVDERRDDPKSFNRASTALRDFFHTSEAKQFQGVRRKVHEILN